MPGHGGDAKEKQDAGSADSNTDTDSDENDGAAKTSDRRDAQLMRALEVLKSWTYFEHLRDPDPTPSLQANANEKQL